MKTTKKTGNAPALDKARVLELLAEKPNATKRDLAKILGLKGSDRITLKRILKELEGEGAIKGNRRIGYAPPGALPDVAVLEITGQDADGELLARPQKWESNDEPPQIVVVPSRRQKERRSAPASACWHGSRAARTAMRRASSSGWAHRRTRCWACCISARRARGSHPSIARAAPNSRWRTATAAGAEHNELVLAEPLAGRAQGFPRAKVVERLGSMNAPKTVSLIAIHAHGIPTEFPKEVIEEAERAAPPEPRGRTDLRGVPLVTIDPEDARDHDDAVWAGPDDDPKNSGGYVALVAIADVAAFVRPGTPLDREAYKRGNSAYFPDRVVPMLPEALSADLCSLKEGVDRALSRGADGVRQAWQEAAPRIRARHHALGCKADLPPGRSLSSTASRTRISPTSRRRRCAICGRAMAR